MRVARQLLLIAFAALAARAQDPCEAILKYGVYDFATINSETDIARSILSQLRKGRTHTESSTKEFGGYLGVVIEGIPIDIGGTYSRSQISSYSEYLETLFTEDTQFHQNFEASFVTHNPQVISAWSNCIDGQLRRSGGGAVWIVSDEQSPVLKARFNHYEPTGSPADIKVEPSGITFRPTGVLRHTMTQSMPFDTNGIIVPLEILNRDALATTGVTVLFEARDRRRNKYKKDFKFVLPYLPESTISVLPRDGVKHGKPFEVNTPHGQLVQLALTEPIHVKNGWNYKVFFHAHTLPSFRAGDLPNYKGEFVLEILDEDKVIESIPLPQDWHDDHWYWDTTEHDQSFVASLATRALRARLQFRSQNQSLHTLFVNHGDPLFLLLESRPPKPQ